MGIKNHSFSLALLQPELAKYDPHNLKDPSQELIERIALECKLNPWYLFREVVRVPASGSDNKPINANRAALAMIWSYFNNVHYIAIQPRQTGKAQPLDALIKTPGGWKRMGDVHVGDLITTPSGVAANVISVHPQGYKGIYCIRFEDGRYTECCDEHLWKVYKRYGSADVSPWSVMTLKEIRERLKTHPNRDMELYVPLPKPEIGTDADLPVDPYIVGTLIGRDDLTQEQCDTLNLVLARPSNRTIPKEYLNASSTQRVSLLQGLMDTDGVLDHTGHISYSTSSRSLSQNVQHLVWSLGGICKIIPKYPHATHEGVYKDAHISYTLSIQITDPKSLFRSLDKRNIILDTYVTTDKLKLGIKSVEYVGRQEAQCIEIDHPDHLYVTDNYIVTHNTIVACAIVASVIYILARNFEISLYTKDVALIQENVKRVKSIREAFPKYLIHKQINDTDNKQGLSYTALNNNYRTAVAQSSREDADNLGRGMTSPSIHNDEPAYCDNIHITYPVMMLSTIAAIKSAKEAGMPHSNILTTTAGPTDTERGRYAFKLVTGALPFSEKFYDLANKEELLQLVASNSTNGMINGTFSYLQLGLSIQWYLDACRANQGSPEVNDRELLNQWTSGTETSLLSPELIKIINKHKNEPSHSEIIQNYVVRWYVEEAYLRSTAFLQRHYILGMDCSETIGKDFTTFVMIDVSTMTVLCTFRCNESNTIKLGMFIAEFLIKYKNVTFIPERNSTGTAIIDTTILILQKNNINPFRRIFNEIVQRHDDPDMKQVNIDDYHNLTDTSTRRHLGFRTTGKSRPFLYKNTFKKAVSLNATRIYDTVLISELSSLSIVNGRIDHSEGGHDDMVIAYLLACWLIFSGENLHYYGIDSRSIMTNITADGDIIDPIYRDKQLEIRAQIKYYKSLVDSAQSDVVRQNYRQKIYLLQTQIDHDLVVEPVGVSKVQQDVKDYGKTHYTPQAFARERQGGENPTSRIRTLLEFIH